MAVNLNSDQVNALQDYLQTAQYADGYNYLRDVINRQIPFEGDPAKSQDLTALSAWFDAAAHINSNDGSVVSELVRGATESVIASQGSTITDKQFQDASDTLAITLLTKIIQDTSIGTAQAVVNLDIQNGVDSLNMPPWGWPENYWGRSPIYL